MESLEARRLLAVPVLAGLYHTFVPFSQPRFQFATVTVGDDALFAGGYSVDTLNNTVVSDVVDIYNAKTGQFSEARLSQPEIVGGVVVAGTKAIFYNSRKSYLVKPGDTIDIFDSSTNGWTSTILPHPGDFLTAVVVGDQVLFSGSPSAPGGHPAPGNVVDIYHTQTGRWTSTPFTSSSIGSATVAIGSKAYFVNRDTNDIQIYDSISGAWSQVQLPVSLNFFGTQVVVGGKLAVFYRGGIAVFDPASNAVSVTELPRVEFGSSSQVVLGTKVVFDGSGLDSGVFDVVTGTWTPHAVTIGSDPSVATVGTKAIFGGGFGTPIQGFPTYSDSIDIYDAATDQWSISTVKLTEARGNIRAFSAGHLAVFGHGYASVYGRPSFTIDVYDDSTGLWSSTQLGSVGGDTGETSLDSQLLFTSSDGVELFTSSAVTVPSHPSPAAHAGISSTPTAFTWDASPEATNYDIYLDDSLVANVTINQWTLDRTLNPGPHSWQVVARDTSTFTAGPRWTFQIGAPAVASQPAPAVGAALSGSPESFGWNPSFAADSYDVYLDGAFFANVAGTSTKLGQLLPGGSHTWRVDSRNGFATTTGPLWTFTTPSSGLTHSTKALSSLGEVAAIAVGNTAIFAANSSGVEKNVDLYNASTRVWTSATLSQGRSRITPASVGNTALFAGGQVDFRASSNVVDLYNVKTHRWTTANLSAPRSGLTATTVGNNVLFAGGLEPSNLVDVYHARSNSWSKSKLSQARSNIAGVSSGHFAFFAGGVTDAAANSTSSSYSDVVDIFDSRRHRWSTAHLSIARAGMSTVKVGTKVIFAGGYTDNNVASDIVDLYDLATGRWSTSKLPEARMNVTGVVMGNQAIFAGGSTIRDQIHPNGESDLVEIYHSDSGLWSTQSLVSPRVDEAVVRLGTRVLIASGASYYQASVIDVFDSTSNSGTLQTLSPSKNRGRITGTAVGDVAIFAGGSGSTQFGGTIADLYTPDPLK